MDQISYKALYRGENRYKYNGIELDSDLDLYSYEARYRNLDPLIGRWSQIDPKTEKMEMWSPYASNYNNPIRFSDFLGDEPGEDDPGLFMRFVIGLAGSVNAYVSNNTAGVGRTDVERTGLTGNMALVYQWGQKVGDAASMITGTGEMATAGAAELSTGGAATPVAVPLAIHGAVTTAVSAKNLFSPIKHIEGNTGSSSAPNSNKVEKSKTTENLGDGKFTKTTEVRPGKGPGLSRAVYVRYKNELGKVIKTFKDTYDRANKFIHRKPLRGGPEGRPQND